MKIKKLKIKLNGERKNKADNGEQLCCCWWLVV